MPMPAATSPAPPHIRRCISLPPPTDGPGAPSSAPQRIGNLATAASTLRPGGGRMNYRAYLRMFSPPTHGSRGVPTTPPTLRPTVVAPLRAGTAQFAAAGRPQPAPANAAGAVTAREQATRVQNWARCVSPLPWRGGGEAATTKVTVTGTTARAAQTPALSPDAPCSAHGPDALTASDEAPQSIGDIRAGWHARASGRVQQGPPSPAGVHAASTPAALTAGDEALQRIRRIRAEWQTREIVGAVAPPAPSRVDEALPQPSPQLLETMAAHRRRVPALIRLEDVLCGMTPKPHPGLPYPQQKYPVPGKASELHPNGLFHLRQRLRAMG